MNDLIIYGAGDNARELIWTINEINDSRPTWNIIGIIDDAYPNIDMVYNYKVLGGKLYLGEIKNDIYVVISISSPSIKRRIVQELAYKKNIRYATIIHPSAIVADKNKIGDGSIIYPASIISVEATIAKHVHVNQKVSINHDVIIDDYSTIGPGSNLGGHVKIGECVDLGIGCNVKMLSKVGNQSIIGAGAVVIKDIPDNCTAVGIPAKPIKFHEVK